MPVVIESLDEREPEVFRKPAAPPQDIEETALGLGEAAGYSTVAIAACATGLDVGLRARETHPRLAPTATSRDTEPT